LEGTYLSCLPLQNKIQNADFFNTVVFACMTLGFHDLGFIEDVLFQHVIATIQIYSSIVSDTQCAKWQSDCAIWVKWHTLAQWHAKITALPESQCMSAGT
jgi:hypothetical protein